MAIFLRRGHRVYPLFAREHFLRKLLKNLSKNVSSKLTKMSQFIVVPLERQIEKDSKVAELFIRMTYGSISNAGKNAAPRAISALLAISSLGML